MQKSRRIVRKKTKTGDKSKEAGRFDKFVITRRFAFINRETGRCKPKPRDLGGLKCSFSIENYQIGPIENDTPIILSIGLQNLTELNFLTITHFLV